MKLSIVIPAYNEEKRIGKTLEDYSAFFRKRYKSDFEIVVVLNNCRDNTLGVVKGYEKKYGQIKHLDFKTGGKGFAIIEGFKVSGGRVIGFTDADDSTSAKEFDRLTEKIGDFDGAIGSRWMKESRVSPRQPMTRRIASRGFNFLTRVIFGMDYADTQCGAKVFKRNVIADVLPRLGITEWAFDIDLLYQMKLRGFDIKEIPMEWRDAEGSNLNVPKTTVRMFFAMIRLKLLNSSFKRIVKIYDRMPDWLKIHHRLK